MMMIVVMMVIMIVMITMIIVMIIVIMMIMMIVMIVIMLVSNGDDLFRADGNGNTSRLAVHTGSCFYIICIPSHDHNMCACMIHVACIRFFDR
jgi:hypothetical protein